MTASTAASAQQMGIAVGPRLQIMKQIVELKQNGWQQQQGACPEGKESSYALPFDDSTFYFHWSAMGGVNEYQSMASSQPCKFLDVNGDDLVDCVCSSGYQWRYVQGARRKAHPFARGQSWGGKLDLFCFCDGGEPRRGRRGGRC